MKKKSFFVIVMCLLLCITSVPVSALTYGDTCRVIFYGYDAKTVVAVYDVPYGDPLVPPVMPDTPGYTFLGWYDKYNKEVSFEHITSHMFVYAKCSVTKYQVTFYDENGVMVGSDMVAYGQAATPPATLVTEKVVGNYKYVLKWNQDFSCVTSNLIVQATRVKCLIAGNSYTASNGYRYKATGDNTVSISGTKKGTSIKTLNIPATVKLGGVSCKVTGIGANAFKKCSKLTTVTIGTNVASIEKNAFLKCTSLKKITIKSAVLSSVKPGAFKGIYKSASFTVPKGKKTVYTKLLKMGGLTSKMKVK